MRISSWVVHQPATPMAWEARDERAGAGEVIIEVAGCGVCHTDLGFFYDGVPTRHPLPLTLGHEISGTVVEAGPGAEPWLGRAVVVPAVLPCGECAACRAGRGQICPKQIFPGCDVDGGFGTHLKVPARGLCAVPDLHDPNVNPHLLDLSTLSVIADAVSTPYQAILRSGLEAGDLAVFVGAGGIGGFGVQLAAARGAVVVAIDVNDSRLQQLETYGATLTLNPSTIEAKQLRRTLKQFAEARDIPSWRTHIFETSGSPAGQVTAFSLIGHGSVLSIVGYTPQSVEVKLSNLMAFDATVQGNWACLPEHYPDILNLVLQEKVAVAPFIESRPLRTINHTFEELHHHHGARRVVLVPEN